MKKIFSVALFSLVFIRAFCAITITGSLPNGLVKHPYASTVNAVGGTKPYAWSVSAGTLPTGLTLLSSTQTSATLQGTPTVAGVYSFTVSATGRTGGTGTQGYTVTITQQILTTQNLTDMWCRSVPDCPSIWDTWYNAAGGSSAFTSATYTTSVNIADTVLFRKPNGIRYKSTYTGFNNVLGNLTQAVTGTRLTTTSGANTLSNASTYSVYTAGNNSVTIGGTDIKNTTGAATHYYANTYSVYTAANQSVTVGMDFVNTINGNHSNSVLGTQLNSVIGAVTNTYGNTFTRSVTGAVVEGFASTYSVNAVGLHTIASPTVSFSGLVGVGTTAPTAYLSIVGSQSVAELLSLTTNTTNDAKIIFNTNNSTGNRGQIYVDNTNQLLNYYVVNNDHVFWNGVGLGQVETMRLTSGGDVGINKSSSISARLQVVSTGSTSASYVLKTQDVGGNALLEVRSDGLIDVLSAIDAVTGDAATINTTAGRFRKDNSGATFTLTNSLISANSIILLTAANAAMDATAVSWTVSAGSGSATITFVAAPTADFNMNFLIIN